MNKYLLLAFTLFAAFILAACGGSTPVPATSVPATKVITPNIESSAVPPTAVPPTAVPPTATLLPPTPTVVPSATKAADTATPAPTATPTGIAQSFGGLGTENQSGGLTMDSAYPTLPAVAKSGTGSKPTQVAAQPTKAPPTQASSQSDDEVATVIYQTKFDSCDGYPQVDEARGTFDCKDGEYIMALKQSGLRYVSIPGEYREGVYQITGRVAQDGGQPVEYGMFFGLTPNFEKGYSVSVRTDGAYNISRIENGEFVTLIPYTLSTLVQDKNKIGIIHQDGKIALFLNDEFADTVFDQPEAGTGLAMWAYSDASAITAAFDDAGVSKLNRALNFPTPKAVASNPPAEPTQARPTPPPPPPTEPPQPTPEPGSGESNGCRLAQGESGLIISNSYPALMTLTIGGGDWGVHDYEIPGDGERYLVTFPAGVYPFTVTIAGIGSDEGEPYDYQEGTCREISYSP